VDNVYTIEQIFSERLLLIPDYQRGYAWDRTNLVEFTDDLELLPPDRSHYTGTIILDLTESERRRDAEGGSYELVDVVDGQQRLTTIILFLNAIRRQMDQFDDLTTMASGIKKRYVATTGRDHQPMYKLTLNQDTNRYWTQYVLSDERGVEPAGIRSEQRLAEADAYFDGYLQRYREELGTGYGEWLQQLHHKLTYQLKFTLYNVTDADAGAIFEVMNARGKPLTELELVKNYLLFVGTKLQVADHSLRQEINSAWGAMFGNLMRSGLLAKQDEDQLLRMHWITAYDPQSRNWMGSKSIKDRFSLRGYVGRHEELLADLLTYTRSLREASQAFCEIANPRDPAAFGSISDSGVREEVKYMSEKLRRTKQLASFLPLLMAARLRHPQDGSAYLAAVDFCERFAFRVYVFMKLRNSAGQAVLFRLGHRLYQKQISLQDALTRANGLALRLVPQKRFESEFALQAERDWYDWQGIKYFLYEYEEHRTGRKQVKLPWDVLDGRDKEKSIEHILPQTPDNPYWQERFSEEDVASLTHDIGNLALTQDNSSLSNKPFPEKRGEAGWEKACYANSLLLQERDLIEFAEWAPESIRKRREGLAEWALTRWAIDENVPLVEVDEEEDEPEGLVVDESLEDLEEESEGVQGDGRKRNRPPRGADWWKWYVEEPKHSVALIAIVRRVVEGIQTVAPSEWQIKPSRNQISFRAGGKKIIRIDFWGATVGLAIIKLGQEPDPNPFELPGKVEKRGHWSWEIARLEQVPDDMTPLVEIVEKHLANG
jgi:hypothetical protein